MLRRGLPPIPNTVNAVLRDGENCGNIIALSTWEGTF